MDIIKVRYYGGRCGSSMVMGLLELSGVDVGAVGRATSPENAKGFFEIEEYFQTIYNHIPSLGGFMPEPPSSEKEIVYQPNLDEARAVMARRFRKWFKGDIIAVKCPFYIPEQILPTDGITVSVDLWRPHADQAKSIEKLNSSSGDFKGWLDRWGEYSDSISNRSALFSFDNWIHCPVTTYNNLYHYLRENGIKLPKKLSEQEIREWIDPKLASS